MSVDLVTNIESQCETISSLTKNDENYPASPRSHGAGAERNLMRPEQKKKQNTEKCMFRFSMLIENSCLEMGRERMRGRGRAASNNH